MAYSLRITLAQPLFIVLLLVFFSGAPRAEPPPAEKAAIAADAEDSKYPKQELTPQIIYQFLLAEIAVQNGQLPLAASAYFDLAKTTRDSRIVQRAAELAFHARQFDNAIELTRLWQVLEPTSLKARQMVSSLLLASGRVEELAGSLTRDLAGEGPQVGNALLALANAFARYPDRAAVQRLFDQLTQPYLNLPEARFVRAQAALQMKEVERAKTEIDAALALKPEWEAAALLKAEILQRNPPGQTEFLRSFIDRFPNADDARLGYARALVGDKKYDAALLEFKKILVRHAENPDVLYAVGILSLQIGDLILGEETLKRFLAVGRGDLDSARFYLGQIADQSGRAEEALRWYGAVLGGESLVPARIRTALLLLRLKRPDEARAILTIARIKDPDDARLIVAEAQLLRDTGHHADSYALLNAALVKQPDQPDLLYEAALAAEKLGEVVVMERRLRHLITLKPDSSQAYNALGYSFADRNLHLKEAADLIDKALSLSPDDPFILDSKAWLLFRQGKNEEALDLLTRVSAQRPDPEIAAHLGEVLWALGRRDEAINIWQSASKRHPENEVLATTIKRFRP